MRRLDGLHYLTEDNVEDQLRSIGGTDLYRVVVGFVALRADLHAYTAKVNVA
jgi:hypothetical protein